MPDPARMNLCDSPYGLTLEMDDHDDEGFERF